ncbi:uncharacterized protein BYT42DRAFT_502963, partial [Radiomyces spectabilis]|uniref:uncharacterized protein n=1 Tax=Radiomyces spectabilis TaxID=64574 RepID=UPI00222069B0
LKEYLSFAIALASEAGAMIQRALETRMAGSSTTFEVKYDNPTDLVTETDQAVEQFIGEETMAAGAETEFTDAPTWIVDPIDGTTNFIHGYPFVAVSIGLTIGKEPVLGVVFNPLLNEMYSAAKGHGAFLNQTVPLPLCNRSSPLRDLSDCLVATEAGSDRSPAVLDKKIEAIHTILKKTGAQAHSVRATGSAALNMCSVAKGIVDVYWEVGCWEWDVTAAIVILNEAGGVVVTGGSERDENPVNIFSRKYLAIRPAADRASQLRIAHQMWDIIPAIDAPRKRVPESLKKMSNIVPSSLRVVDLRAELSKRQLPTKGKKDELIARLEEALQQEQSEQEQQKDATEESDPSAATEQTQVTKTEKTDQVPAATASSQAQQVDAASDASVNESEKPEPVPAEPTDAVPAKTLNEPTVSEPVQLMSEAPPTPSTTNDTIKPADDDQAAAPVISEIETTMLKHGTSAKPSSETDEVTTAPVSNPHTPNNKPTANKEPAAASLTKEDTSIKQMDVDPDRGIKRKRASEQEPPKAKKETDETVSGSAIYIKGFVRPLIIRHVQELINKYGTVKRFWMDAIKTHCYVIYETDAQAKAAYHNIHGIVFPPETGRQVTVGGLTPEQAEMLIEQEQAAAEKRVRLDWEALIANKDKGSITPTEASSPSARRSRIMGFEQITKQLQKDASPSTEMQMQLPPTMAPVEIEADMSPALSLDQLFRKTTAVPPLYYMPVDDATAKERLAALREQRAAR